MRPPEPVRQGRHTSLLFVLFFVSGFCGLLYQIVWLRMAFASFGVITPVLSVVVSVFMLGLALGSWAAGRGVEALVRRTSRPALFLYGVAELGIGIGAFAVPVLFEAGAALLLPVGEIDSGAYLVLSAAVLTASILPWCFLMGTTFPLVIAHLAESGRREPAGFSFLYLANVLGATLGVLATALVLIEWVGFRATLWTAAVANFGIAAVAFTVARRRAPGSAPVAETLAAQATAPSLPRGRAYALLFTTGFASMAMEVVWTRAFTPVLTTTIYAFASLLATYLVCTWVGTSLYRAWLRRGRTIATLDLLCWLCGSALLPALALDPRLGLGAVGVLASIVPLCVLLGALTPKLVDEFAAGDPDAVGRSYGVNIVGSILGPLCAAYLLLPLLSLKWVLMGLAAPFFAFALHAFGKASGPGAPRWHHQTALVGASVLAIGIAAWSTSFEDPRFYDSAQVRRDHTATVVASGAGRSRLLLVNGVGLTHPTPITKLMAHLPLAHLSRPPEKALVLCLGMGTTLRSAASWGVSVTTVELVPSVVESFPFFFDDAEAVLARDGVEIVVDDARRYLERGTSRFDVVTIDPPPPIEAAGSSLLYSVEFYELLKTRMTEDAVLQQWFPHGDLHTLHAVARALTRSFAYVRVFRSLEGWGAHFLASQRPLPRLGAREILARMPGAARDDLAEWVQRDELLAAIEWTLRAELSVEQLLAGHQGDWISDDHPINEYYLLRRLGGGPLTREWGRPRARAPAGSTP